MDQDSCYQYAPLTEPDSMRLVVLEPSPDLESPIHASIIHTTLTDCQNDIIEHYVALSYVWGDQTSRATISISGQDLSITSSLNEALQHIREGKRRITIWADGVCINQADVEERNQQVRQMGAIYENAMHTIIFLGPGTRDTDWFLETLKSFAPPGEFLGGSTSQIQEERFHELSKQILERPWFRRVWVFQELVLSADPWLQVGTLRFRWEFFCRLMLPPNLRSEGRDGLYPALRRMSEMNDLRSDIRRKDRGGAVKPDSQDCILWNILLARRANEAFDPRDMIYAHLGMIDVHTRNQITIDYSEPAADVFEQVAKCFLASRLGLEVLFQVGEVTGDRLPGLPSWVPDWTSPLKFEDKQALNHAKRPNMGPKPGPQRIQYFHPRFRGFLH